MPAIPRAALDYVAEQANALSAGAAAQAPANQERKVGDGGNAG